MFMNGFLPLAFSLLPWYAGGWRLLVGDGLLVLVGRLLFCLLPVQGWLEADKWAPESLWRASQTVWQAAGKGLWDALRAHTWTAPLAWELQLFSA